MKRIVAISQDKAGSIWLGSDITFGIEKGDLFHYSGKPFTDSRSNMIGGMYRVPAVVEDNMVR